MLNQYVDVDVLDLTEGGEIDRLDRLLTTRRRAEDVIAIIGKTDGTGLGKDPAREAADHSLRITLSRHLGIPVQEVGDRISIVLSGGSPGVITPHVAVITRRLVEGESTGVGEPMMRMVAGLAHSEPIEPHEVGRLAHIDKVAAAVRVALSDAGLDGAGPADVHAVLVKAPSLTEQGIADALAAGRDVVTRDLGIGENGAMCYSNDASALGVAVALGEVRLEQVTDDAIRTDFSLFSEVALASAGGEKTRAEVVVLGNGPAGVGPVRIGHSPMRDIVDAAAVPRALASAGLTSGARDDGAEIAYLMMKMIVPGARTLHGGRITLHDDAVGYHVAKAMGGHLLASATGLTRNFVSGGESNSHQGPPDGNPLAAIVRFPA